LLRFEILNSSLMIVLFGGTLARVDIHEPSEGLHFGVRPDMTPAQKDLRYVVSGTNSDSQAVNAGDIIPQSNVVAPIRNGSRGVISINTLASLVNPQVWPASVTPGAFTSAEFALELVQGVERVTFNV